MYAQRVLGPRRLPPSPACCTPVSIAFLRRPVSAECNAEFIKAEGQAEFLKLLDAAGYYVSTYNFRGPFLSSAALRDGTPQRLNGVTLFCVKKSIRDAATSSLPRRPLLMAADSSSDGRQRQHRQWPTSSGNSGSGSSVRQSLDEDAAWAAWFDSSIR